MLKAIHFCLLMYLTTLETSVLKYMNLILLIFVCIRISMASLLKKTGVKLELLTNIDMLLMAEKGIKGRICYAIHRYAKANNKYMKHYNKDIECNSVKSSYLIYLDANNLYGWAMYQKLPVNDFE